MLTKYFIEIDGNKQEIPQRCIKNWDEVKCAYKRADYSGVTRSFTSQFEFVGEVYDMLMALYLRDGFKANAILSLYTITDRWEWEERFVAPIDFSSLVWNDYTLKVNCIDNSLAAYIKANKATKYEFAVGDEIPISGQMEYDRIPMVESLGYQIIGEGNDDDASMIITKPAWNIHRVPVYMTTENVLVNGTIKYQDQTEDGGSYILEALSDVSVQIEAGFAIDRLTNYTDMTSVSFRLYKTSADGTDTEVGILGVNPNVHFGTVNTPADLSSVSTGQFTGFNYGVTVVVKSTNTVWQMHESFDGTDSEVKWRDTHLSFDEFQMKLDYRNYNLELKNGDKIWIGFTSTPANWNYNGDLHIKILKQDIKVSWGGIGKNETIDVIKPQVLCEKILERISMGKLVVNVDFSNYDNRFAKTYLLAAESVRAIAGAKIYSSFTEFVDWMQTVFGYTYYLGPRVKAQFKRIQEYSLEWPISSSDHLLHTMCPGGHGNQVVLIKGTPYFAVLGDDYNADKTLNFYTKWNGSENYNDPNTGKAYIDTLFYDSNGDGYYFDSDYNLHEFVGDVNNGVCDTQSLHFVHRSELFRSDANVRKIPNIRETSYTIETATIYSSITIGYEKQDYEGFNGRDEFNFNNTYSTGHTVKEKNLSLLSKYRADCYGIEFAVQKRGQDTTDSTSDKDVFFVLAKYENNKLVPDRTISIQNAISDLVFNGAFSPMACVLANAGYIGMQAKILHLEFASSVGNSSIIIDGQAMSNDIEIHSPLMTCGRISFTTNEVDEPASDNDLVEIESNGIVYRGFIEEAVFKYAKNEAVKYKLIVKDIEL